MTKKIIITLFGIFTIFSAYAAQIVNVEYIHQLINQKWDITLNYSPELRSEKAAANMKYLLTAIDVANEILNGEPTTDYGNGEFATTQAVDTIATNTAVDTLVKKPEKYVLELTHFYEKVGKYYVRNHEHLIMVSAAGTFYIDWGDGTEEVIEKTIVGEQWFGHDYATDGTYTVRLGGCATEYSSDEYQSTVLLSGNPDWYADIGEGGDQALILQEIKGCLGCVFPTLADGSQPRFIETFYLAHGVCSIPENLFAGINGAPASRMFYSTFPGTQITSIPENLFAGINGAPASYMFYLTFESTPITSIPENLFAGIDTTAPLQSGSFSGTFYGCSALTGPSARINGKYLYEIWPDATSAQVGDMYFNATGLTDYTNIPDAWKPW